MSISKLMLRSPNPAASDADAFAATASRRGNSSAADDPDAPSFDDALQESRRQYTQAATPAPDPKPTKPSKPSTSDDQNDASDGAQTATAKNPESSQKSPAKDDDDGDSKPVATDPNAKKDKSDKPVDPSTLVIVQPATTPLPAAPLPPQGSAVEGKRPSAKAAIDAKAANALHVPAQPTANQTKDKAKADPANQKAAQPDSATDATSLPAAGHPPAEATKSRHPALSADSPADNGDAPNDHLPALPVAADAINADAAAATIAQTLTNAPAKPDASNGQQPLPLGVTAAASVRTVTSAEAAHVAQESHAADPADPMDQIVLGLKSKMDPRTGKAEFRLDPPNLGAVKVSLSLQNGSLTAQFESSSEVVRDLLKSHLGRLKTVLERQGVAVDRLAVEPPADTQSQGQSASFGSASHDGRSAGQYQQDPRQQRGTPDAETFAGLFSKAQDAPLDLVA